MCFTEHLLFVHENIINVKLLMNFGILCKHFGTVTQCSVDPTVPVLLTANFGLGENFQKKNSVA